MESGSTSERMVLRGGVVIDGTGASPRRQAAVVVSHGRIERVCDAGEVPLDGETTEIDLTGRYLLPGFVNAHDHLGTKRIRGSRAERARTTRDERIVAGIRDAYINLREGFTTIREAGSRECTGLVVKTAFENRTLMGPRIVSVGSALTATAGYAHAFFIEVDTPSEARRAAGDLIKRGVDWIKCAASIEWERGAGEPISGVNMDVETMRAAFELGHHHGKPCMAHAIADEAVRNAVLAGADTIEHGCMLSDETAALMAERGVRLVPTLSGYREHSNDWGRGPGSTAHGRLLAPHQVPALRRALAAGVKVAVGTDTLGDLCQEISLMQEAGIGPMDCICALTRNGAELLGLADDIGTLETGKRADLVVLHDDPLASADAFSRVLAVIRDGRIFDAGGLPV